MTFSPSRALRHPAWIACLFLLATNDHLLKGAGVLPGWLTGKASDFAGLFVAPALLALVLRARSKRVVAIAHVAVALGFAVVKAWEPATRACEAALGVVVPGSRMWTDPTDLVALPMVALSWIVLAPRMAPIAATPARSTALGERALAALGAVACFATSAPTEPVVSGLKNDTGSDLAVEVRPVRTDVTLDLDAVANVPSLPIAPDTLAAGAWAPSTVKSYDTLPMRFDSIATESSGERYRAALVRFPSSAQTFLVAAGSNIGIDGPSLRATGAPNGRFALTGPGLLVWALDDALLCAASQPKSGSPFSFRADAIDPNQTYAIKRMTEGAKSCRTLDVEDTKGKSESVELCLPAGMFPFVVGERVWFTRRQRGLEVRSLESSVALAFDELEIGSVATEIAGAKLSARSEVTCFERDAACGGLTAPVAFAVQAPDGKVSRVAGGETTSFTNGAGARVEIALPASGNRALSLSGCSLDAPAAAGPVAVSLVRPAS